MGQLHEVARKFADVIVSYYNVTNKGSYNVDNYMANVSDLLINKKAHETDLLCVNRILPYTDKYTLQPEESLQQFLDRAAKSEIKALADVCKKKFKTRKDHIDLTFDVFEALLSMDRAVDENARKLASYRISDDVDTYAKYYLVTEQSYEGLKKSLSNVLFALYQINQLTDTREVLFKGKAYQLSTTIGSFRTVGRFGIATRERLLRTLSITQAHSPEALSQKVTDALSQMFKRLNSEQHQSNELHWLKSLSDKTKSGESLSPSITDDEQWSMRVEQAKKEAISAKAYGAILRRNIEEPAREQASPSREDAKGLFSFMSWS